MGVAFVATPFNRRLNFGRGDIDFIVKDPRSISFDPAITRGSDLDQAEYIKIEEIIPMDIIKARYGPKADEIKADARVSTFADNFQTNFQRGLLRSAVERVTGKTLDRSGPVQRVILKEYYIKDRRRTLKGDGLLPIIDDLTKSAEDGGVPFPGGRRVIRVGNTILEDTFNPYWDGMAPIDMLSWKLDPETPWSADEVGSVKRLQEAINRSGDAYAGNLYKNSIVRAVLDYGALTPTERNKLSDMAGQIIEKAPGRQLDIMVPDALPPDALNFIDKLVMWVQMMMGTIESPLQKRIPSIVTGPAVEGLQIMVETPIRTAARRLEEFYQRIGQKYISRIFQFYTSDRILNLVGPGEEWKSFEFKRLELMAIKDERGQFKQRTEEDKRKAWQDFKFRIDPQSSLPITRVQRVAMKVPIAESGRLPWADVMEEIGIENPEEKMQQAKDERDKGFGPPEDGKKPNTANLQKVLAGVS